MLSSLRPRPGQQQSDTTKKTPPLPNPPISPIRTPEKLRGQSAQPIRQGEEVVRGVSGAVAIVKRGRGRPPRKRNVNGVCAKVTSAPVPPEQTSLPAEQTSRGAETKKSSRRRGGGKKPQLEWEKGSDPARRRVGE